MLLTLPAHAHLGSKDIYHTVDAGPYHLFVTVRPPTVIPGIATVELRATGPSASTIDITPIPLTGEASKHPPTADRMARSTTDPAFFTGSVWMMSPGSWQIRLAVAGPAGPATAAIPVPAVALATLRMTPGMGTILTLLGLFLVITMAGLIAAAVREARLPPGTLPSPDRRRHGLIALAASLALMALILYGGAQWWNVEAATYGNNIFRPLQTEARLSGNTLDLLVTALPGDTLRRRSGRSTADLLPDHGRLIHLYAIRKPGLDVAFHLHPSLIAPGDFRMTLPSMPPGTYTLYGDIVHSNGFPETLTTTLIIPASLPTAPLGPDDASILTTPITTAPLGPAFHLPDGYTLVWDRSAEPLRAATAYTLRFRLLTPIGTPAPDVQPYLGMAGHAAFVKTDGTVFAHTHPDGTVPMQALALTDTAMPDMVPTNSPLPADVAFPYGFPSPGTYRLFIQMKHGATVETAAFDTTVH